MPIQNTRPIPHRSKSLRGALAYAVAVGVFLGLLLAAELARLA